jgi:hypothetical protein
MRCGTYDRAALAVRPTNSAAQRTFRKKSRTLPTNRSGSSIARRWPPRPATALVRSYPATARNHGMHPLDAIRNALAGKLRRTSWAG